MKCYVHFAESPEKNEHCKMFHTHVICNAINRNFDFGRGHDHGRQEACWPCYVEVQYVRRGWGLALMP